jgi:hypothetical protein
MRGSLFNTSISQIIQRRWRNKEQWQNEAEREKNEVLGQKTLCSHFVHQKSKMGRVIDSGPSYACFIFIYVS